MRTVAERPKATQQVASRRAAVPTAPQTRIYPTGGEYGAPSPETTSPRVVGHADSLLSSASAPAGRIQTKLAINEPDDEYEQEADHVAGQLMRMPEPQAPNACACGGGCPTCQGRSSGAQPARVQTKRTNSSGAAGTAPPQVHKALASPGHPLDGATRAYFEPRLGRDLSGVRVHTDDTAAKSAAGVNARAYAVGQHLFFGEGQYAPRTDSGRHLLAHELVHTVQQEPNTVRREEATCTRRYSRARNFSSYVDLVRAAETKLIAAGYSSNEDRIHVLRGIYYGTTWSADYAVERSPVRNAGFQVYTASTTPDDPRSILDCGLFSALRDSQDLVDGRRRVDAGHLMIGLDARRSVTARRVSILTQGGTGLDISTWLGDLGGGAGMLAFRRVTTPGASAMGMFRGTDFGGPINLEGDVAGFVVARDTTTSAPTGPEGLTFAGTSTIADALAAYLLPTSSGGTSSEWNNRCKTFMSMKGATFDRAGALNNRTAFISALKDQIEAFACWYLVNRLRQTGRLSISTLRTASLHISGAAEEIATIFVDALDTCQSTPGSNLAASGTGPTPTAIGSSAPTACSLAIRGLEAAEAAERALREAERGIRDLRDWAGI